MRQAVFPVGWWVDLSLNADGAADISAGLTCQATPVQRATWTGKQRICKQSRTILCSFLVRPIARGWTTPSVTTSRRSRSTISATGRERRRSRRGKFTRAHTPAHTPACGPGILEARRAGGGRSLCTNRRTSRLARWIARGVRMPQSSTTDSARAAPRRYQTVLTPLPANDNTAARQ